MDIFKKKIEEITIEDIEDFIEEKHPENIRLEYKQGFSSSGATLQVAKEISAFANQQGGLILFGVSEGADRIPSDIVGISKSEHPRHKIRSICIDHIHPPIFPEIQECEIKGNSDRLVVVVRVEMSNEVPHTIDNKKGFYIRGDDVCAPRPMTSDELELLWNRRKKTEERREFLLERAYGRIFSTHETKKRLKSPIIIMAIPLYPMGHLCETEQLYDVHNKSLVKKGQGFPLFRSDIKTSGDGIYCYLPDRLDNISAENFAKERYGEVNIFGQIIHCESYLIKYKDKLEGMFLQLELRKMYFMIKYLANFYQNVGYWGVIKIIISMENCIGTKVYSVYDSYFSGNPVSEVELDKDIMVESICSVTDIVNYGEQAIIGLMKNLLRNTGISIHTISEMPVDRWLQQVKIELYGKRTCPGCEKVIISYIDSFCDQCRNKEEDFGSAK
jgi:hypothetical protein